MPDLQITIQQDGILARYGNMIGAIGVGKANQAFARALNHEGDKRRTQIKRSLVRQTGINYNLINRGMKTNRANRNRLEYSLEQRGDETNLGLFSARQGKKGVSAAPWHRRRIFRGTDRGSFFLPGTRLVFIRVGAPRYPIEPLFGPNLAREIVKPPTSTVWIEFGPSLEDRVRHELERMLSV